MKRLFVFLTLCLFFAVQAESIIAQTSAIGCSTCPSGTTLGPNLVVNGDFSAGNTGFSSDLTYQATARVQYWEYSVRNSTTLINARWSCVDHTAGQPQGQFLVCDGTDRRVGWRSQQISVQPNTDYSFCAFVNNLVRVQDNYADPKIEVRINGTVVVSPTLLTEIPDQWEQVSSLWNSGNASSAEIEIRSTETHKIGNDYAIDDISFAECRPCSNIDEPNDTPPTGVVTKLNRNTNWQADFNSELCTINDVDYYKFALTQPNLHVYLDHLPIRNYDVELLDAQRNLVCASRNTNTRDLIRKNGLPNGHYFVKVYAITHNNADVTYKLRIRSQNTPFTNQFCAQ